MNRAIKKPTAVYVRHIKKEVTQTTALYLFILIKRAIWQWMNINIKRGTTQPTAVYEYIESNNLINRGAWI